jgi:YesN/AraC family two-component response regulator
MIQNNFYNIMLCDVNMPLINGLSLIKEIRQRGLNLPCIIITASAHEDVVKEAFKLGVENLLEKPFRMETLKEKITEVLALTQKELFQEGPQEEKNYQEEGFIYNQLKLHYYTPEHIFLNIQRYNIPSELVLAEIAKRSVQGFCLLDTLEGIETLSKKAKAMAHHNYLSATKVS